ncbi:PUR family DNA/RNA-binding protein [Halosquirtibacter laminarini]|uniref:PUR family DNA/RNA-binding protein n=1 Tax=Halosquirtibacter laminarini TaxID=3374600 RepID=A0AC61NIJ9_9BACT|nr:PUR family DNA/RNA-binding protein [Prolixibacteraceae bacterium]
MTDERKNEFSEDRDRDQARQQDLYSQVVKAGNRTYFLDVKKTRYDDPYMVLTESKKKVDQNGKFYYDKFKVYLYQEDMDEFRSKMDNIASFMEGYLEKNPRSEKSRVKSYRKKNEEVNSES